MRQRIAQGLVMLGVAYWIVFLAVAYVILGVVIIVAA